MVEERKSKPYKVEETSPSKGRKQVGQKHIDSAIRVLKNNIDARLYEKGWGSFASRHEILGILTEEMAELNEAITDEFGFKEIEGELFDIAVGCIFGIACIRAATLLS